jgi:predicted methyltransferase
MKLSLKRCLSSLVLTSAAFTQPSVAADEALQAVIASPHRAESASRDAARHPYETLMFFGLKPQMTVVELSPGGGWYTEILAPYLKERGRLIAAGYDPQDSVEYFRSNAAKFSEKLKSAPDLYGKVEVTIFAPPLKLDYAPKGSADLVLTFRNIHNWVRHGDEAMKAIFQSAYDGLKPGGVFGVVEHRLPANMAQDAKASSGYVHEKYVIDLALSVGFKLAGKSEINANPNDHADHEGGVWALPPTFRNKDKDREKYQAIGESDRMTMKFVKP